MEKAGSILAHEAEHQRYFLEDCVADAMDQWDVRLTDAEKHKKIEDGDAADWIRAWVSLYKGYAANENGAVSKNGDYGSYITKSADWSIGGHNDK